MDYFNILPKDAQLEILKRYPSYRSLSTPYYNEKQIFYNTYCNEPITQKEFIKYFKKNDPDHILLFGVEDGDIHQENVIFSISKSQDNYWLETITIFIYESDFEEYEIGLGKSFNMINMNEIDTVLNDMIEEYEIQYDLVTMENILFERSCELIKSGYAKAYLRNYFKIPKYIDDISTMSNAYDHIVDFLYLRANANQIIGDSHSPYFNQYNDYDLRFDGLGDLIDDIDVEQYHEVLKPIYNESLDIILEYLN